MISRRNLIACLLILCVMLAEVTLASGKETFSFEILTDKKFNNIKRSIEIRLDRRITYEQLENLAHKIKDLDRDHYDKTFILYYLSGKKVGASAWASTHFLPELNVEILGATIEDLIKLRNFNIVNGWEAPVDQTLSMLLSGTNQSSDLQYGGDVVGEWIWELPGGLSHKITVLDKDGTYFMNRYHRDGGQYTVPLKASKVARGLRVEKVQSNSFREHYIINKRGELEFYDVDHDLKRGNILVLTPERK